MITLDLVLTTAIMIWVAAFFLRGSQFLRFCALVCVWQLLTPRRAPEFDLPLLVLYLLMVEFMYLNIKGSLYGRRR